METIKDLIMFAVWLVIGLVFCTLLLSFVEQYQLLQQCEEQYQMSCQIVVVPDLSDASPIEVLKFLTESGE